MNVIQINCVYQQGSTGKLTADLHRSLLAQGIGSRVVYGRGAKSEEPGVIKLCPEIYAKGNNLLSRFRGTMYGGCTLSTRKLIRYLQEEKPDVVHLQCINGYFVNIYRLVDWLKRQKIKTVLTLHAEFMYTGGCAHALDCEGWKTGCGSCPRWRRETRSLFRDGTAASFRKMQAAFRGFEENLTVVSVSNWLQNRAQQSPMLARMQHRVIENGVDTTLFHHDPGNCGENTVFHATAMFSDDPAHPKGGWYLLELAKRMPETHFVVAGKCDLRREVPENVTLLGEVTCRETLARYYASATVTLLTSRAETFSMVCAESLCCGTPVVGFRAGGPEEIALPEYSSFVPFGDTIALEAALKQRMAEPQDKSRIAAEAARRYDRENMLTSYRRLYEEIREA